MLNDPVKAANDGPLKKRKLCLILTACLVLLMVGGLVFVIYGAPDIPLKLWSVAFSPDGKMLVTGGGQDAPEAVPQIGEVVIWNAATGRKKKIIQQQWGVRRAVFSADGKFIATADFGGKTRLLDSATGKTKALLTSQFSQVNAVAVSADSKLIAGCSFEGSITLWDSTGKEVGTLQAPNERILNLAISPDSQWLVAGCKQGNAYLFNLAQHGAPKVLQAYVGPTSYWSGIEAVAFAPNGQTFVTGGMMLRLWRTGSGDLMRELSREQNARLNGLAFSPDGRTLAGVDRDGWLALWNPATGDQTKSVRAHNGASFGVAFSPDGRRVATVARPDFAIKIWNSETLELLTTFRRAKAPR
jgi:WD40 repeat protein